MNSENDTDRTSRSGGESTSATPSIASLNRRLGTSPAPRMLTPSEIDLLRQGVREIAQLDKLTRTVGANNRPLQARNHRLLLAPGDVRRE